MINHAAMQAGFNARFGGAARVFRAPARVNIIGEHVDYNDGFVMPVNTGLYTWLAAAPRDDEIIEIVAEGFGEDGFVLPEITRGGSAPWCEYVKGVVKALIGDGHELRGARLLVRGEIPVGGGLSSSASLEAVVAYAMLSLAGIGIDRRAMALACQRAEREFVGVPCGIMDQFVISLCAPAHAMMLDCLSLEYDFLSLPDDAALLVVHSGVKHSLMDGEYAYRKSECERAVEAIRNRYAEVRSLRDVSPAMLEELKGQMNSQTHRRARHVVSEIERVQSAAAAMAEGDSEHLGRLMNASHDSLRDDYQVSCRELDALVEIARLQPAVLGTRMVGAGFGGCTISLVKRSEFETAAAAICSGYAKLTGAQPWHHRVEAVGPVAEVAPA